MRLEGWRHQTLTQVAQARPAPQDPVRFECPVRVPSAYPDKGGNMRASRLLRWSMRSETLPRYRSLAKSSRWRRRVPRRRTRLALTDPVRVPRFHPDAGGHPRISRLFRRSVRSGDAAALPIPRENHPGGAGASRAA